MELTSEIYETKITSALLTKNIYEKQKLLLVNIVSIPKFCFRNIEINNSPTNEIEISHRRTPKNSNTTELKINLQDITDTTETKLKYDNEACRFEERSTQQNEC